MFVSHSETVLVENPSTQFFCKIVMKCPPIHNPKTVQT